LVIGHWDLVISGRPDREVPSHLRGTSSNLEVFQLMREPRFIYFDLGKVLLFFDHRVAARQMAAVAGITEELAWQTVFDGELENHYEAGKITSQDFHGHFCEVTKSQSDFELLLHAASNIFELNTAIVPLIVHLARARYRLGILSNTNEAHWRFVSDGRFRVIRDYFPVTALSFEIGVMKPDPRIYLSAAELAGVAPREIFYTDDREENVAGALAAGFDAVLFHDARQLADELRLRNLRWNY
jgi:HAD superfamily hydrolase (TIGR01509 family)